MRLARIHESDLRQPPTNLHTALSVIYGQDQSDKTPPAMRQPPAAGDSISFYREGSAGKTQKLVVNPDDPGRQGDSGVPWKPRHRRYMGIKEEYRYKVQTWTNYDKSTYSIKKLISWARKHLPQRRIEIDRLVGNDVETFSPNRHFLRYSGMANSNYPIIVGKLGAAMKIIDGRRRLRKLIDSGARDVAAYVIDLTDMPEAALAKQ